MDWKGRTFFRRLLCLILILSCPATATAQLSAQSVQETIDDAIAAIWKNQNPIRGTWPDFGHYEGGATALCVLALLNAGVPVEDPRIDLALRQLADINSKFVYVVSLQTMVFSVAAPERHRILISRNVKWLEQTQFDDGEHTGGWNYGNGQSQRPDNSNSQFAILALNEAQQAGVRVDRRVWIRASEYWRKRQMRSGGWRYGPARDASGSMTCAGIASLLICERNLTEGDAYVNDDEVVCCGVHRDDDAIKRGMAWMARNFSVSSNPNKAAAAGRSWLFYYLYALERVGRLSGRRLIGDHDWYREGCEFLNESQTLRGEWIGTAQATMSIGVDGKRKVDQRNHITTALSLLFLAKGRRPVLMSKLTHLPEDDWNRHRQDISNLTRHVGAKWQREMTWQFIDHQAADVADLLTSPVIWLSGREGLKMSKKQKESLREYVEQGGFLFAEACCGGKKFDREFRALMKELFPDNELQPIPPSHPVWYAEERVDPKYLKPLYGINSCCRTSVVYCPENLGCLWELSRGKGLLYPGKVQQKMEAALAIGTNVLAYATNRELRDKLDAIQPASTPDARSEKKKPILRGSLSVAKLNHGGGADEAPAALTNLLRTVSTQLRQRVNPSKLMLSATDESLLDYPVLFAHGRRSFQWTTEERKAVTQYVDTGGVVFADAICASKEFARSFRNEMKQIFPDAEWKQVPPSHPLFTSEYKGFDVSKLRIRRKQAGADGKRNKAEWGVPVLEGIEVDDRFVVLFSPLDISCALESAASTECEGYVSEDAAKLGINVLLYALQQ